MCGILRIRSTLSEGSVRQGERVVGQGYDIVNLE